MSGIYQLNITRAEGAVTPTRGSAGAAGYDLAAYLPNETIEIQPGERRLVSTGISMLIPAGRYGRIAPRSGLAYKHGIDVMAGVIDSDYRGVIGVILINLGDKPFPVRNGDRIAQIIIETHDIPDIVVQDTIDNTKRGADGYGSTGK